LPACSALGSEQIHANNQARAIRQLGGEATAQIEPMNVRSTLENLRTALGGENFEINTVHPAFIEETRAHINATAARSFDWALEAERTHTRLFAEAISPMDGAHPKSWVGEARDFYVCPVCATTAERDNIENCTIRTTALERLEVIR